MSESRQPIPMRGSKWITRISDFLQLAWRLFVDERVLALLKLLPIAGLAYVIFPYDVPLPLEDLAILWLALYLFIELCPPEIVKEHRDAIETIIPATWTDSEETEDG